MSEKQLQKSATSCGSSAVTGYLLNCPFCGGMSVGIWQEDDFSPWQAGCNDCDVPGPASDTKEGACKLWNSRGPREFTHADIIDLFVAVEHQVDANLDNVEKREYFKKLSEKVRLLMGTR